MNKQKEWKLRKLGKTFKNVYDNGWSRNFDDVMGRHSRRIYAFLPSTSIPPPPFVPDYPVEDSDSA
jgi:hypothetical protein